MTRRTEIVSLSVERLALELTAPFGIASGEQREAGSALVRIGLADGSVGLGEAAPFTAVNGETLLQAVADAERGAEQLSGHDATDWLRTDELLRDQHLCASARCAVEVAALDAACRSRGSSMWRFLGARQERLVTDVTITTGSVESARRDARHWSQAGFRLLKIKVGGTELPHDLARLQAIQEAAPNVELLLDGNCGLTAEQTAELVSACDPARLVALEQPGPDLASLEQAQQLGVLVVADESATCTADVEAIAAGRVAGAVNVKPMKSGLVEAWRMLLSARDLGLQTMVGGMVESELGMGATAALAAALGDVALVDLDTPLFFRRSPFRAPWTPWGPELRPGSVRHGHGVELA